MIRRLVLETVFAALGVALCQGASALVPVTDLNSQGATDGVLWTQNRSEESAPGQAFTSVSQRGVSVAVRIPDGQGIVTNVCPLATPCGWTGAGFSTGEGLIWTSTTVDGWVTINFPSGVANAGALVQPDLPGAFTAEVQATTVNSQSQTFSVAGDSSGRAIYLGFKDPAGQSISSIAFHLKCTSGCGDFAVGTLHFDPGPLRISVSSPSVNFGSQEINETSGVQAVTLRNTGLLPLAPKINTTDGQFYQTNNCGASLPTGGVCTINLSFRPTRTGPLAAALNIGDGVGPVSLNGNGVQTKFYGTLYTTDAVDRISWSIVPYAVDGNSVSIKFCIADNLTWRKTAFVEFGKSQQTRMSVADDGKCLANSFTGSSLKTMELWKAKFLGIMTWVDSVVLTRRTFFPGGDNSPLPGGTQLTLTWTKDQ